MSTFKPTSPLDTIFEGGIILKGLSGLLELIGGILLFFLTPVSVRHFIELITQEDLISSHPYLHHWVIENGQHFTNSGRWFLVIYLWIHAIVKLVAVIGMLKNQLWAYPFSLVTLGLMTLFQVWHIFFVRASFGMIFLTLFDVIILWLIWREYKKERSILPHLKSVEEPEK